MRPIYQYYYLLNIWKNKYYFKRINPFVYYAIILRDFTYFISIIKIIIVKIFIYFEACACITSSIWSFYRHLHVQLSKMDFLLVAQPFDMGTFNH